MSECHYQKLSLVLQTPGGEERRLTFRIDDTTVAQRWAAQLESHLRRKTRLEKSYLFHGWLNPRHGIPVLCAEINRHIGTINSFFSRYPRHPYRIDLHFDQAYVSRHGLNEIHQHFEQLIGQIWNLSKYFLMANKQTRYAILQINHLCHLLEAQQRSENAARADRCDAFLCASLLPTDRILLEPGDYQHFSPATQWGDVYLHYAQLGKQHLDAFYDQDELVGHENISGLRYLSGEFDVCFSDPADPSQLAKEMALFRDWMIANRFDPDDPTHGIGRLVVARFEAGVPANTSSFMRELFAFDDLREISLTSSEGETACRYEYRREDPGHEQAQASLFKPGPFWVVGHLLRRAGIACRFWR